MELAIGLLGGGLLGTLCTAGLLQLHAKALERLLDKANADRRAEVERNHALRSEMTAEALRRAEQAASTRNVRTINGRGPG